MPTRCPMCRSFAKLVEKTFKGRKSRRSARRTRRFVVCKRHGSFHLDGTPTQA